MLTERQADKPINSPKKCKPNASQKQTKCNQEEEYKIATKLRKKEAGKGKYNRVVFSTFSPRRKEESGNPIIRR